MPGTEFASQLTGSWGTIPDNFSAVVTHAVVKKARRQAVGRGDVVQVYSTSHD